MGDQGSKENQMPAEIDFSKGVRGLHHVPARHIEISEVLK
jgi:hypothetical protein